MADQPSRDTPSTSANPEATSPTATQAVERARDALEGVTAAELHAERARNELSELRAAQRRDISVRDRLREEKDCDDARRILDGETAVPRNTRRDNRLIKLDEEIPARTAAISIMQGRVADAEAAITSPKVPFVAAILDLSAEAQGDAVDAAREILGQLAPLFARVIAADQIRSATIGDQYPVPNGMTPPFRGFTLVRNFLRALPDRIRPAALSENELCAAAHEISAKFINQIKGNAQ